MTKTLETERRREAVRVGRKGLGPGLKAMFDGLVREPVPDNWLALLDAADQRGDKLKN